MKRVGALIHRARGKKFVRDTLVLQAASIVQNGTYLVTSVLTARLLGRFDLGRWNTSRELYMFAFFLVSMGLTNAAVAHYSRAHGAGDEQGRVNALAAFLKLGGIVSLLLMGLGLFAMPRLGEEIYGDRSVGVVASVLCFSVVGDILRGLALAVLAGSRQMGRYAAFDVTTNVLRVGLVGAALGYSRTPMAVGVAFLAHGVLSGALALRAYRQASRVDDPRLAPPNLRQVWRRVPTAPLRDFFGLAFLLALSKAMNTLVPRLGMLVIPVLATETVTDGFKANGAYSVGLVLTMVLTGAISAVAQNVLPTLGQKTGESDVGIDEQGHLLRRLSLTAGGLAVLATLLSIPVMWLVVEYVYGPQFSEAFDYYLLLATGNLFIGFAVVVEPFYIYAGRMRHHVAQSLVYASLATAGIVSASLAFGPKGTAAAAGLCRIFVLCHLVYIWVYFRRARARRGDPPSDHTDSPGLTP